MTLTGASNQIPKNIFHFYFHSLVTNFMEESKETIGENLDI